jgi:probable HAF family extracellular repeat protein
MKSIVTLIATRIAVRIAVRTAARIAAGSLLAGLAMAQPPRYTVTDLGAVGPAGQPFFITNNSLVSGAAAFPGNTLHAVLWYKGVKLDIGTPGLNSMAFGVNQSGQAVGEGETHSLDPKGEDFCGFAALGLHSPGTTCRPFLSQRGVMIPLPTLGGNNGAANYIDNHGGVAGMAENASKDPGCPVNQFKPVIWQNGKIQELPTHPGDPDGAAFAINDHGQVVGGSGDCTAFNTISLVYLQPLHALLWQDGKATDLGNLGGTGHGNGIEAVNLNNQGQVVGNSDLKGDASFQAFLWTRETGMRPLGTLPGDANSAAIGINDAGEVVGVSLDASFNPRAFLRHGGVMTDLNTLVPAASPLFLLTACSINSHGEIIGIAVEKSSGDVHGYLATPGNRKDGSESAEPDVQGAASPTGLSEDARKLLQQRLPFGRFGARLMGPPTTGSTVH